MAKQNAVATGGGNATIGDYNMAARQAILRGAIKKKQIIYTFTGDPSTVNYLFSVNGNFIRMAGLLTKFIVEVSATFTALASNTVAETQIGRMNLISNAQFTDLQNNQRHNCSGAQLALIASRKRRKPYGASFNASQSFAGNNVGSSTNNHPLSTFTALTSGATGSANVVYEVPVSIDERDLTGAIFLGVYGAQLNLQLQLNPTPFAAAGDSTFNVGFGSTATFAAKQYTTVTITVYQEYYDQLPQNNGAFVLPPLDISTVYQLTYTNYTNISAGQDYYIPYANYRKYLSQSVIYNNSGADGGLSNTGVDVSYWALVAANFTQIFKVSPIEQWRVMREMFGTDMYNGLYVFDTAEKPIDTQNYGNLQLDLNAITAGGSAYAYTMSEFIAYQNQIAQAPSLPSSNG